jgi:hypothetical protein
MIGSLADWSDNPLSTIPRAIADLRIGGSDMLGP